MDDLPAPSRRQGTPRVASVLSPAGSVLAAAMISALISRGWDARPDPDQGRSPAGRHACVVVLEDDAGTAPLPVPPSLGRPGVVIITSSVALPSLVPFAERGTLLLDRAAPFLVLVRLTEQGLSGHRRNDRDGPRRRAAATEALSTLTPAERETLGHLSTGLPAASIARRTHHSVHTVRSHIRSILLKLDVTSQLAAVAVAHGAGPDWNLPETVRIATFGDVHT